MFGESILKREKSMKNVEARIREKEKELLQLQEFAKKSQTNFIRNVRPRLLRLFPELYKGKDGNQRLLRDTRYLKISCNGKIPEATADEETIYNSSFAQENLKLPRTWGCLTTPTIS